jgi:D-lactate dehydrogenase (cytochrome)
MDHVLFGHIGDNHLHLNLLPKDQDELDFAKEMYRELALMAVSLGGTVSAEHGIGKIKKELLAEMLGDAVIESFRSLKSKLDPNWILGRGILFSKEND